MKITGLKSQISNGFTIVELLVVISIISILCALLFPVLGKAKEKARKSACLGNLRQLGVSVIVYAGNNADYLPMAVRVGADPDDPKSIRNMLEVQSGKVFECPADSEKNYEGETFFDRYGSSYEWNAWLSGRRIDRSEIGILNLRICVPMMGDANNYHGKSGRNYVYSDGSVKESLEISIE
ncbi:MAG: type II secretion system protein [Lentisphaerota bacterium]